MKETEPGTRGGAFDCPDDEVGVPANAYYQGGVKLLDKARVDDDARKQLQAGFAASGVKLSELVQPAQGDPEDIERTKKILDSADAKEVNAVLQAVSTALEEGRGVDYLCSIDDTKKVVQAFGGTGGPMIHFHVHQGQRTVIVAAPGPPAKL
jgi:hypothetical protein